MAEEKTSLLPHHSQSLTNDGSKNFYFLNKQTPSPSPKVK